MRVFLEKKLFFNFSIFIFFGVVTRRNMLLRISTLIFCVENLQQQKKRFQNFFRLILCNFVY